MKKAMKFATCVGVAVLLGMFASSAAFAGKTLVVAVGGDIPTMKMKDAKGSLSGYEIDMIGPSPRRRAWMSRSWRCPGRTSTTT